MGLPAAIEGEGLYKVPDPSPARWAWTLLNHPRTFDKSTSFTEMARWADETTLSSICFAAAFLRLFALIINGTFTQHFPYLARCQPDTRDHWEHGLHRLIATKDNHQRIESLLGRMLDRLSRKVIPASGICSGRWFDPAFISA